MYQFPIVGFFTPLMFRAVSPDSPRFCGDIYIKIILYRKCEQFNEIMMVI